MADKKSIFPVRLHITFFPSHSALHFKIQDFQIKNPITLRATVITGPQYYLSKVSWGLGKGGT